MTHEAIAQKHNKRNGLEKRGPVSSHSPPKIAGMYVSKKMKTGGPKKTWKNQLETKKITTNWKKTYKKCHFKQKKVSQ